ncbi:MAG: hypothetical protein J0I48_02275 [Devosia sp.]|uniref:hypothetical protein n=1 Tax=Devosia sp. 66-22 TaxID=1895753 RepID=UPI00092754A2|nr:hypothetical protein [Devosia sp. 66-22]MBN9345016.1 hypothetical protein [Devosia sp.]OJX50299.1 MAG: hypothetical protein BGO81_04245 [Devosia sp. 66-22]
MLRLVRGAVLIAALAFALAGCAGGKPAHYYVFCEDKDGAGWKLVGVEKDAQGYLMACTYQSPDKSQSYTVRCRDTGCD